VAAVAGGVFAAGGGAPPLSLVGEVGVPQTLATFVGKIK